MTKIIGASGGYRQTLPFGFACLIYHATATFCRRNCKAQGDPQGKTAAQMIGAARSARQYLAEDSARAGVSTEAELRLTDVAKASLEELAGDFEAFLTERGEAPWSESDHRAESFREPRLDPFKSSGDQRHEFGKHILAMRQRFAGWLENEDAVVAANAILIAIDEADALIRQRLDRLATAFTIHPQAAAAVTA